MVIAGIGEAGAAVDVVGAPSAGRGDVATGWLGAAAAAAAAAAASFSSVSSSLYFCRNLGGMKATKPARRTDFFGPENISLIC